MLRLALILYIFFGASTGIAQDRAISTLTTCMATYSHYARVALMYDSVGLAREALIRASRSSAAWMFAVAVDDVIQASDQRDAANVGQLMNSMFNNDRTILTEYLSFCEREAEAVIRIFSQSKITLWSLNFDALQDEILNEYMQELSLRRR